MTLKHIVLILALFLCLGAGLAMGYAIGANSEAMTHYRYIQQLNLNH